MCDLVLLNNKQYIQYTRNSLSTHNSLETTDIAGALVCKYTIHPDIIVCVSMLNNNIVLLFSMASSDPVQWKISTALEQV